MKKKTNSSSTNDSYSKLSDDKRKKISNPGIKQTQTKNKSITDFITVPNNSLPANCNKITSKAKKFSENKQNLKKNINSHLKQEKEMINNKFEEKTIFNEEIIDRIHIFFSHYIENLKSSLEQVPLKDFSFLNFSFEEINKYFNQNITNFLVKFFLQLNKRFLYIPRTFQDEKFFEKEKIVLFDGFDETRHLSLKYDPIKSCEVINQGIAVKLKMYLKKYHSDNIKADKGFLLFDKSDDYFQNVKLIEALCNDYHYKIIRIDELEKEKNRKLNKISEACQSQRIFTLKDSLNDKTKLLQNVVSQNETVDSNSNCLDLLENQENSNHSNTSLNLNNNSVNITANLCVQPVQDSATNKVENMKIIVDNIRSIGSSQKNLILIFENFLNFEEDKSFYSSLCKLVSISKCPVVLITNCLHLISNEEMPLFFKYFSVFQTENVNKKRIIFHLSITIFLEVVLKKDLLQLIEDKNINDFKFLVDILNSKKKYFDDKLNKEFFDRFVLFIIEFCYLNEFSLDRINFSLKSLERFCPDFYNSQHFFQSLLDYSRQASHNHISHDNLLVNFTQYVNSSIHDSTGSCQMSIPTLEDASELNKENHLIELTTHDDINYDMIDDMSYIDELEGCISRVQRRFSRSYEYEYINKNKTNISAKNGKIQVSKSPELIDCEKARLDHIFSREASYFVERKRRGSCIEDTLYFQHIQSIIKKETGIAMRRSFPSFLSSKNNYELLSFLNYVIGLDNENFDKILMRRITRSYTRRLFKINSTEITLDERLNALLRFFVKRNLSVKQLKGMINTYDFKSVFTKVNEIYYVSNTNLHFYTDYRIYEEIENSNKTDELCSYSSDYEHKMKRKRVKI